MWKAKAEKISPRQLFRQLKKATTTKLCKELFIQAYSIGKKALMLDDLELVLVLITRKNGFNLIIQNLNLIHLRLNRYGVELFLFLKLGMFRKNSKMETKNIVNMYGDYQYFRVELFFFIYSLKEFLV